MRLVRQNDVKSAKRAGAWRGSGGVRGGVATLAAAVIVSGCAGGGAEEPAAERGSSEGHGGGRPAHGQQRGQRPLPLDAPAAHPLDAPAARSLDAPATRPLDTPATRSLDAPAAARAPDAYAAKSRRAQAARVVAAKRWGLAEPPLSAPVPPAKKPALRTRKGFEVDGHVEDGLPPVFTTIPTSHKVVFLTIDDGAEKDPAFLRMMSDLKIPYTAFLSDYLVKADYGYFERMRDRGVVLDNHTLNHPYLPALSYAAQKREICGMQDVIEKRYGRRPTLFRPPYGSYDQDTLRAAKVCGIEAVPLWNEEVFVDRWEHREWDRELRPGDIVLSHFRGRNDWKGTMPDMIRRFLNRVTAEGYAVARLEDYL